MTTFFTKAVNALLLDIEGTTTPIDFVYKTLFPYAKAHVADYLEAHRSNPESQSDVASLIEENAEDAFRGLDPPLIERPAEQSSIDSVARYVYWLMDRDSKATPLKSLQGKIWEAGYNSGELKSEVFEDVPRALLRWRDQGKSVYIYSSGSVLAQKLLFASTQFGDLTPFISDYFDTNVGGKKEAESYSKIVSAAKLEPNEVCFVSDVVAELDAAVSAGLETVLCVRPGNHPQVPSSKDLVAHSFDEILP